MHKDRTKAVPSPSRFVDDERLKRLCYHAVGQLRVFAELEADSLRGEFYFEPDILREWAEKFLPKLREASYPLGQFLENWTQAKPSGFLQKCADEWTFFDGRIEEAIAVVALKSDDRVAAIFNALNRVNTAFHRLVLWQEWMEHDGAVTHVSSELSPDSARVAQELDEFIHNPLRFPGERSQVDAVGDELDDCCAALEKSINSGDQLSICRDSRFVFLMMPYAQIVAPRAWALRREKVIQLHETAIPRLEPGTEYYKNTYKRLTKLRELSPERYEAIACDRSCRAA